MTLSEFKAWFQGFTEEMGARPTEKQWTRIKKRVKEIDDQPVTRQIFIDRWYEPYRRWWSGPPMYAASATSSVSSNNTLRDKMQTEMHKMYQSGDTTTLLQAAGAAEFKSL